MNALREIRLLDLEIFALTHKLGSVRMAGRALGLVPSQISRSLKSIESRVGVQLFQRSSNGMHLTPAGLEILGAVQIILFESRVFSRNRGSPNKREEMKLYSVGVANYLMGFILEETLPELMAALPRFQYRFIELFSNQMLAPGVRGAIEFALHVNTLDWPMTWTSTLVGEICWKYFARAEHPLFAKAVSGGSVDTPELEMEEVLKYPFITPFDFDPAGDFGYRSDLCPVPSSQRIRGHEAQRADTALRIALMSDQICFIPEVPSWPLQRENKIRGFELKGFNATRKPVFLSVQTSAVNNRLWKQWIRLLKKGFSQNSTRYSLMKNFNPNFIPAEEP